MRLRPTGILGLVLVVVGIAALLLGGISVTRHETLVDLGPLKAELERRERVRVPPALAVVAIGSGLALLAAGIRRAR